VSDTALSRVPAVDGWFTIDDEPHLIGTRCGDTGSIFFPPERNSSRAPGHLDATLTDVPLSTRGRLWSYTNAGYQPPAPFVPQSDPYIPFCIAAVELEAEQIVILGQCPAGVTVDDLKVGMAMELVIDTLDRTEDSELLMWKWQPLGWSAP